MFTDCPPGPPALKTSILRSLSFIFKSTSSASGKTATVASISYAGDNVSSATVQDAFPSSTPTYTTSQRRVTVQHSHHGMHDTDNNVVIEGVKSEVSPTYLTSSISDSDTTIQVNDATAFHTVINLSLIHI